MLRGLSGLVGLCFRMCGLVWSGLDGLVCKLGTTVNISIRVRQSCTKSGASEYIQLSSFDPSCSSAALGFQFVCGTHSACLDSSCQGFKVTTGLGFSQGLLIDTIYYAIVSMVYWLRRGLRWLRNNDCDFLLWARPALQALPLVLSWIVW